MSHHDQKWKIDHEHPIGGEMSDILRGLIRRLQLDYLVRRYNSIPVLAVFSFINGCVSIAIMAFTALITGAPFVVPSLGPTAFLFFYTPTAPSASPRNALVGHAIGAVAGWVSLQAFGLANAGPAVTSGMTWPRVLAAALSLGLTSGIMVLLKSPHPPAGATTLLISLGVLRHPWEIGVLLLAVVMLTIQAFVINRAAGIDYPLWNPRRQPAGVSGAGARPPAT